MRITQGRFVWHDLSTTDVDGAKRFYTAIAPWTNKPWDDDGGYELWEKDGTAVGGITRLTEDMRAAGESAGWMPSVYVYDVDACVRQVPKIGGRVITPPREIPQVGCWAVIAGPEGAPLAMFEPSSGSPPGHAGAAQPGEFGWHELVSNDWRRSWEFYQDLFHWERIREHDLGATGRYFIFGVNGDALGGMFTGGSGVTPSWTSYVQVPSVKEATERVKSLGGRVVREPHEVPGGSWIALCADPQGATFALTSTAG